MEIPKKYRMRFLNCELGSCQDKSVAIRMVNGKPQSFCTFHSILGREPLPGEVQ